MTTSATHITFPIKPTSLFEHIQALVKASGPNKHDQAVMLCTACIQEGWDTISQIMETGARCGLSRAHIARILTEGIGNRWRLDKAGRYSILE